MNVRRLKSERDPRRGVTLVEMLVTLAVLLLMMALVVQIFQAATGSMSAAQAFQRLDDEVRRFDSTIRADLDGATARFTPPLDPKDNLGYFEYIENEFADNDGEDCDDALRFTAKAPEGRPFTGRMWARPAFVMNALGDRVPTYRDLLTGAALQSYLASQPITVTSDHAEIIYFQRNGNLYRRVLLVAPELQSRIVGSWSDTSGTNTNLGYFPESTNVPYPTYAAAFTPAAMGGMKISWQGANDLSAHPASRGLPVYNDANNSVRLNTLADLTDRQNRFASPRFSDDFASTSGGRPVATPDGVADDFNGDSVPDWYPTLYRNLIEDSFGTPSTTLGLWNVAKDRVRLTSSGVLYPNRVAMGFPFIYPGSYSQSQYLGSDSQIGWIHSPAPYSSDGTNAYYFSDDPINYLRYLNHNPIDAGDNLPIPYNTSVTGSRNNLQTYWGFPTWRETLAPEWSDPTYQVNQDGGRNYPAGFLPLTPAEISNGQVDIGANVRGRRLLPPMNVDSRWRGQSGSQLFSDGAGANTPFFKLSPANNSGNPTNALWSNYSWEDDLLLTNVRSFDVKAFDPALANYADLGWGDDPRLTPGASTTGTTYLGTGMLTPYLFGNYDVFAGGYGPSPRATINGAFYDVLTQTFAHEGRMPPLVSDFRFDAQFGAVAAGTYGAPRDMYTGNLGDNSKQIVRLRRVWDSWSTTYTKAPGRGVTSGGFPSGPPFSPPMYPSYPPPYPAPLRGIQIQVRVTDPTNQRIKVITIRQDFSDKL